MSVNYGPDEDQAQGQNQKDGGCARFFGMLLVVILAAPWIAGIVT